MLMKRNKVTCGTACHNKAEQGPDQVVPDVR